MPFNETLLRRLLLEDESDYFDFKQQWHVNNAELVHDILCLANSLSDKKDRFLIFGVTDKTHEIIGVGANRKTEEDVLHLLQQRMATLPSLSVKTILVEGKSVDILQISPEYRELPYVLTQEYQDGKKFVRKHAAYCRTGAINTPITANASVNDLAELFRRREGRHLKSIEQFWHHIKDIKNWDIPDDSVPLENPIFCKSDTQLTIHVATPTIRRYLHNIKEDFLNYSEMLSFAPLSQDIWSKKRNPINCSTEESIASVPVSIYWGMVAIFKCQVIEVYLKYVPFLGAYSFFLPDEIHHGIFTTEAKLKKSPNYQICCVLAHLANRGYKDNNAILPYLNWEYIKQPGKYYEKHKDLLYEDR